MRRFSLLALCLLLSGLAKSQSLSPAQTRLVFKGIDSAVSAYARCGSLLEPGQLKSSDGARMKYYELFKDSFTLVYGDLLSEKNAILIKEGKNPKLNTLPLKDYVTKTGMKFRYGLKIKIQNIDADLAGMKNNTIKVLIDQKVRGIKSKGLEVENQDTIAMHIEFSPDYSTFKIAGISPTGLGGAITVDDADKKEIEALKPQSKKKK